MKRNSIDMRIELLAAARSLITICEARLGPEVTYQRSGGVTGVTVTRRPDWMDAMDRLKLAAAQYDEMVTP